MLSILMWVRTVGFPPSQLDKDREGPSRDIVTGVFVSLSLRLTSAEKEVSSLCLSGSYLSCSHLATVVDPTRQARFMVSQLPWLLRLCVEKHFLTLSGKGL